MFYRRCPPIDIAIYLVERLDRKLSLSLSKTRHLEDTIMANKEELNAKLDAMATGFDELSKDTRRLTAEMADLKDQLVLAVNANDLSEVHAKADALGAKIKELDDAVEAASPEVATPTGPDTSPDVTGPDTTLPNPNPGPDEPVEPTPEPTEPAPEPVPDPLPEPAPAEEPATDDSDNSSNGGDA